MSSGQCTDRRVQLISALAAIRARNDGVESTVRRLVDTLWEHLDTPVAASLIDHGESPRRWTAGDKGITEGIASQPRTPFRSPEHLITTREIDGRSLGVFEFAIGDNHSAAIFIDIDGLERPFDPDGSFWNCLATTAEATFHNARLFELNQQKHRRLRFVIDHMPMAVGIFDTDGNIQELNLRAQTMAQRPIWEHIPLDSDDEVPYIVRDLEGNELPRDQWPLGRAVKYGELCDERPLILDFGDQQRTISLTVRAICDDDGNTVSYMATARDISHRSNQEEHQEEFLSVARHELRGPLTPLKGLLQLAERQADSENKRVEPRLLKQAESQVERIDRLLDGLLDISRLETGKLPVRRRLVDLGRRVREAIQPWMESRRGERFELALPDQPVEARVDPDRIDQVVTNLVDNAVTHGRDGGAITVELRETDGEAVLTVRDSGDGIPREVVDRVFDRFFFASDSTGGSGLGLYVARQIVDDHGGAISIDSDDGQPTTVTVRLPME